MLVPRVPSPDGANINNNENKNIARTCLHAGRRRATVAIRIGDWQNDQKNRKNVCAGAREIVWNGPHERGPFVYFTK